MSKPRLIDLYCSAGGCSVGYHRAGFEVIGVDIMLQPHYPYEFIQMNVIEFLERYLNGEFPAADAFGASPPCQKYTKSAMQWRLAGKKYPDLIAATRALLIAAGKPYIIENVPGAPLINPVWLTGTMFGLMTQRERLFECSFDVPFMLAPPPHGKCAEMGRQPKPGEYITVVGHFTDVAYAKRAMGIDWMNRAELSQAIPPAYTQWLGERLLESMAVSS